MNHLVKLERFLIIGHILAMSFGLAGLLIVLPHPELIASLSTSGQTLFRWSMAGGGVVYIILGAAAVAIYAYRTLGLWQWLTFMVPAFVISLSSELLGTSTGFPFGEYAYLSGLGYKIASLVPFTIPLSWFYMGFVCYLIARAAMDAGVAVGKKVSRVDSIGAILLGAMLLTAWDFALDPAMSRTAFPFWYYGQQGAFFGTPYQNFAGWLITAIVFMTVSRGFWQKTSLTLSRKQLLLPVIIYVSNVIFGAVIAIVAAGLWIPVELSIVLGIMPVLALWGQTASQSTPKLIEQLEDTPAAIKPNAEVPIESAGVMSK
ncbi:MAG: carotenoid biosynthesis protein [Symploca sp. SIO1C4]|uniref:Carotenoid biosynthesis protein n=1 Tax=Symploca sp. SIO1C4 TaxID=2607765 RepID=A0A6B3N875_9CYAN|nr:carotenoid biosynthesis protein [Symploca sp. SIO1C4]